MDVVTLMLLGTLMVLALVDSTSIGTLILPIFFLLAPGRVRGGRVLVYLGTIAFFYFLIGLAILLGAGIVMEQLGDAIESDAAYVVQLVLGVILLAVGLWLGFTKPQDPERPGRITRWRDRALQDGASTRSIVALALVAGVMELATMLPYLAAIGLLTTSDVPLVGQVITLAAYCLVMVLPALALLALRILAADRIEPTLARIAAWMQRNARENTAWIVGIVGFVLAQDAADVLGILT